MCLYFWPIAWRTFGGPVGTLNLTLFWPFGPLWGSWRRLQLDPLALSLVWRTCLEPSKPMPGPLKFWSFWPLFPIEKVNFGHFCLSGVSENAILTLFWPILSPPEPKPLAPGQMCAYFSSPLPWMDLEGPSGTLFDPNFDHFGPLWGSLRMPSVAGPVHELPFGWGTHWTSKTHMPGTSDFGHFDHFSHWKSQFLSFCLSGVSVFDPILTPIWAFWAQFFGPGWGLVPTFGPLPGWTWRTSRYPNLTLILTILDPFEGSWRRLQARPSYKLPLGWRTCSEPHKPMPGTSNFGHFDHFSYWKSQFCHFAYQGSVKMPFWPHFEPSWAPTFGSLAKCAYLFPCPDGTLEDPEGP